MSKLKTALLLTLLCLLQGCLAGPGYRCLEYLKDTQLFYDLKDLSIPGYHQLIQ